MTKFEILQKLINNECRPLVGDIVGRADAFAQMMLEPSVRYYACHRQSELSVEGVELVESRVGRVGQARFKLESYVNGLDDVNRPGTFIRVA